MKSQEIKLKRRIRRKMHLRKNLHGGGDKPRLTVIRSSKHIYAQIIDDNEHRTLVSASTIDKELRELIKPEMKKSDKSKLIGSELAKRAIKANIERVIFDRNGFLYHGRIKAFADGAREAGLKF
jgi:large subunit ribosomal protein L18